MKPAVSSFVIHVNSSRRRR